MTLRHSAAAAIFAATALLGACAHQDTTTVAESDYGRVDQAVTDDGTTQTAVIPGPAKVDDTGAVFTSSAAGGAGNASVIGTNTNVNLVPEATVTRTESTVTYSTPTPAPPVTIAVVEEEEEIITPAPMVSSVQEETTTRVRMSKD